MWSLCLVLVQQEAFHQWRWQTHLSAAHHRNGSQYAVLWQRISRRRKSDKIATLSEKLNLSSHRRQTKSRPFFPTTRSLPRSLTTTLNCGTLSFSHFHFNNCVMPKYLVDDRALDRVDMMAEPSRPTGTSISNKRRVHKTLALLNAIEACDKCHSDAWKNPSLCRMPFQCRLNQYCARFLVVVVSF
jgi:hypothetical protein